MGFELGFEKNNFLGNGIRTSPSRPSIQRHLRLLICSLMIQVLARRLTSSFDTFIGQYIRGHLCRNMSSFASSLFVILQVSHPCSSNAMTLDLKILILVFLLSCPLLQILASLLNAPEALPRRFVMSSSAPPCLAMSAPR